MTNALTISSHDELISYIPHALGFTPESSMICLAFGGGPTSRLDLPDSPEHMDEWVKTLTDVYLHRHPSPRMALVAFGEDGPACVEALVALSQALVNGDVPGPEVGPVLWVNGDQWTDVLEGASGTVDPSSRARIDAEFALMGRVMPVRGRADLATAMQGDSSAVAGHLPAARARVLEMDGAARHAEVRWLEERLEQFYEGRTFLSDVDAARVLAVLDESGARDEAAFSMRREDARVFSEFWQDLARRAPAEVRDAPVTLLALSSYLAGSGAKAWIALDQLSERDRLADLVAAALQEAVDPRTWDRMAPAAAVVLQQAALRDAASQDRRGHDRSTNEPPNLDKVAPDAAAPGR